MGFFDQISKTITDAGQGALQKGKDIADVAKYNSMIATEEKKIASTYEAIGKRYVELYGTTRDLEFAEAIQSITDAKRRIVEYKEKVEELKGFTKCPNCGAEVPNGSVFCASCGTKMAVSKNEEAGSVMYCSGCGARIPDGSHFCTTCGRPVESMTEQMATPQETVVPEYKEEEV